MKYRISITAWYLNMNRICQLLRRGETDLPLRPRRITLTDESLERDRAQAAVKQLLEEWLHCNSIPSLGSLLAKNERIAEGSLFTIYHDFYGKGLTKYANLEMLPRDASAEIHNTLKYGPPMKLRILYSPANLTCDTACWRLMGHTRLFALCYVESYRNGELTAHPYVIGDLHNGIDHNGIELEAPDQWFRNNYGEISPTEIDQFSKIQEIYQTESHAPKINILKDISELQIKQRFATILHESDVPKDWGGEKSDLFSSNISVNGKQMSAAFLFKGPSKFSPMTIAYLGRNGDQIDRLFSEPADLLVLQHCHKVTPPVRNMMRAYAARVHDLRHVCIIDGYDTVRILTAYGCI